MKVYSTSLNYHEEIQKAEAGDVSAMVRVAFAILHGNTSETLQPEEAELAIGYYKRAAELGDKSAMLDLGACYMDGRGVKRDVEESLRWYERGWDPNDPNACFCLGCINRYDYPAGGGEILSEDPERISKALQYFKRGAELMGVDCLYELGELCLSGKSVKKYPQMAFALFMKAFEEHDDDIISDRGLRVYLRLAECWHYGIGTKADLQEALDYIQLFREEQRRRMQAGELEEDYIIERAEKEWIAINRALDAASGEE